MPKEESSDDNIVLIHSHALTTFDNIQSAQQDERKQCLEDRRFYSIPGAQWEGPLSDQFENKPKFEVNKTHLSVIRIINEYRNNRVTVDFISKDGSDRAQLADTCDMLYRSDEQDSNANEAYDNCFEEGVGGGIGAWRLRADLEDPEDDENDYQRIFIEPIYDADTCVYFDLSAKRQDKSDAKECFVLTPMTPEEYEDQWEDTPASWLQDISDTDFDWNTPDTIYVAEYYKVEEVQETIYIHRTIDGVEERYTDADFENDEDLESKLIAIGTVREREKRVKRKKIHKYIMSGGRVLEDCGYIAGQRIPIVPFYGKRWIVDNIERYMGHVRLGKDAQRLGNIQRSKLGEISALSSVEKPIFLAEQVTGFQDEWAEDNIKDYPFLRVNPVLDASGNMLPTGPIGYTKPPQIPPALAALLQVTEQDMKDIFGNQQGGEEIVSNISGKAVELIQTRLDMQSFIYMSNFAKAMKASGEIWLGMAKELYVELNRKMKTIDDRKTVGQIQLNKPTVDEEGKTTYENDLSKAKFGIVSDVGPSSSSKKAATVKALTGMMQITTDPETVQVLSAMAMMNMEGEGIDEANDYFRQKLIRMGAAKPTKEEQEELQKEAASAELTPNDKYLEAAANAEEARGVKAQADTVLTVAKAENTEADTEKKKAETAETLSGIDRDDLVAVEEFAEALNEETAPPIEVGEIEETT